MDEQDVFFTYNVLAPDPADGRLMVAYGSIIFASDVLLVFEESGVTDFFGSLRQRLCSGRTRARNHKADYLMYLLISDGVIDMYTSVLYRFLERIDTIEDTLTGDRLSTKAYRDLLRVREELKPVYRYMLEVGNLAYQLEQLDTAYISQDVQKRLGRDLTREVELLWDEYKRQRALITELINIHRNNINEATNRIIHRLTIISTVFLPLSFIVGVYGMNFAYMPELEWRYGYLAVWLLILAVAGGMLYFMKRNKWF
ncbi:MAG: hypothetical protein HC876_01305 [Chloroflexaceae bacterium]|nr:hypothetical protein [Chloroflexaceae bacterium]